VELARTEMEGAQPGAATNILACTSTKDATTKAPARFLTGVDEASQAAFNRQLEPLLHTGPNASGVMPTSVPEDVASACAAFLREKWTGDQLKLGDGHACLGYHSYFKTLRPHDPGQQALSTLMFTNDLLAKTREHLPGFASMEVALGQWLRDRFGRRHELYYAHAIKQGPATLRSTGFGVHQDTEDFDFIDFTIVVKLTPDNLLDDGTGEPPSAMRVVGAPAHFRYGPLAGDAACFRARLFHASVAPPNAASSEHLKMVFFFRRAAGDPDEGERRRKRKAPMAGAGS